MSNLSLLASVFLILADLSVYGSAQASCFNNGNYTNNSMYSVSLNTLLPSLSTEVDYNGFYNASTGKNPNTVYGSVLCRGDTQLSTCRSCVQSATTEILRSCPNHIQAVQFMEFCTLRYSNESMFGIVDASAGWNLWNQGNASSPDQFMADVRTLVDGLRKQAANGGFMRKVAAGSRATADFQTVFSLVQCTPDLSLDDCDRCLIGATSEIINFCNYKKGCRVLKPSCILRYEDTPFYNETRLQEIQALNAIPPPPPPSSSSQPGPTPAPPGKKDDSKTRIIIIVVVVSIVCLATVVCTGILLINRAEKKPKENLETAHDIHVAESLQYDFSAIKDATNNFSVANKLGEGGFGAVYKGKLPDGQEIAVKRLSIDSSQGDQEFKNEVSLLAKLQHRNLVRLLGFSLQGKERLLVYEFVKNASLDRFIFDPTKRNYLDWERRYKIIGGISRGLQYLHEESRLKIIHRDLKASNILLDGDMNAKIADFGVARLSTADESMGNTNRIVGTYGYMSPEYAMHGQFSVKSDVFSFGVIILEIVTGRKNYPTRNGENLEDLLTVAWNCWRQRTIDDIIDPVLKAGSGSIRDMLRCIHVGLLCVQDNPTDRPTMASVVLMLSSFTVSLPIPLEPTFFASSGYNSRNEMFQTYDSKELELTKSSDVNKSLPSTDGSSENEMSTSQFYPR